MIEDFTELLWEIVGFLICALLCVALVAAIFALWRVAFPQ